MVRSYVGHVKGEDGTSITAEKIGTYGLQITNSETGDVLATYPNLKGDTGATGPSGATIKFEINTTTNVLTLYYVDANGNRLGEDTTVNLGIPGPKGDKGDKGDTGDPATSIDLTDFLYFDVDTDTTSENYGMLYAYLASEDTEVDYEYDNTTGTLYKIINDTQRLSLGNVQGPATLLDNTELNNTISTLNSNVSTLQSQMSTLNNANLISRVASLESRLDDIEEQETLQNNLLGVE